MRSEGFISRKQKPFYLMMLCCLPVCYAQRIMRIFVALDLDQAIRERIQKFVEEICAAAPDARWISGDSMHVTLKFIGEQPDTAMSQIEVSLRSIHAEPFQVSFSGTGFFPT